MNNYIPLNKAVGPVCIYDGSEPLIDKKLGVEATKCRFDGSECEHASCSGAPEMFIKVEEDGLYYFGVEADDTGSISIANEKLCEKDGAPPNGKLNLATGARFLKAGYYKVALSYTNNAYTPVSNNAAAFNVTMDREPIQAGKYEGNSTMKREFSPSPKIKLWTIEKESVITCEESKKVEVTLEEPDPVVEESEGICTTDIITPQIFVTACKDEVLDEWRLRVQQVSGGSTILLYTGGYRDALKNPPVTEEEAVEAVTIMNRYQSHRLGTWHTQEASLAHEEHHRREFNDAFQFYWDNLRIQDSIEMKRASCEEVPKMEEFLKNMQPFVAELRNTYSDAVYNYVMVLPDDANDRPYCAGQKVLNEATRKIIAQAKANGWSRVPDEVTEPGMIEPPCFLPPVNGMYARSVAAVEESAPLTLSIADTSRFREGKITIRFRNEGNGPVRIPDEINDETSDYFFLTVLRTDQGNFRVLNRKGGKITFHRSLNYRELVPGREYSVTIPVCLDEVDLEGWKQCSCELETRYYNQQGEGCFRGMLRATAKLML
ncbi:PA14 domain-containing protein [uncultured Akkermansia sp.]|uniref:PA14 domain-containing protein n=1 Tax=uncultured Akkermansia sp. TaxID=512294 RepID=UPI002637B8D4|nr:PA14 domain-containing protein [uncultured Akkermansia sp.]